MRLRHIKGAEEQIAESPYVIQDPQGLKGKWHEFFGNQNPIRIEVGMGKGKFIMELAEKNPDVNYIGIERYSSVLLRGLQKRSQLELSNIYFMRIDALELAQIALIESCDGFFLFMIRSLKKTGSSNLKPTTRTCSGTPWSPFRKPDGRWMPTPSIFTTAKWRRGM